MLGGHILAVRLMATSHCKAWGGQHSGAAAETRGGTRRHDRNDTVALPTKRFAEKAMSLSAACCACRAPPKGSNGHPKRAPGVCPTSSAKPQSSRRSAHSPTQNPLPPQPQRLLKLRKALLLVLLVVAASQGARLGRLAGQTGRLVLQACTAQQEEQQQQQQLLAH
jgi:hypothetical protein